MFSTIHIDASALLHNLRLIKQRSHASQILAMVKSNAYGCGLAHVIPALDGQVDAFGVVTLKEALAIRKLGSSTPAVIIQGVLEKQDWDIAAKQNIVCVVHQVEQLPTLLTTPLQHAVSVWLKINTGMNRLGLHPNDVPAMMQALNQCTWVKQPITLMTHFANADVSGHPLNDKQIEVFQRLCKAYPTCLTSLNNSAAIFHELCPQSDIVRPGISLYGVSPFADKTGLELGLKPVMCLTSIILQTYSISSGETVGYGSTWQATRPSRLGIIPVGYGDGYPRVVRGAYVWIAGNTAPIVGRISMNAMVVDLTDLRDVHVNTPVELWGPHLPIEHIASAANTIAYELLCRAHV